MKRGLFKVLGIMLSAVAALLVASPASLSYHRPEIPEELLKRKK